MFPGILVPHAKACITGNDEQRIYRELLSASLQEVSKRVQLGCFWNSAFRTYQAPNCSCHLPACQRSSNLFHNPVYYMNCLRGIFLLAS